MKLAFNLKRKSIMKKLSEQEKKDERNRKARAKYAAKKLAGGFQTMKLN